MTSYTVEWMQDAEDDLARIYLQAADKQAVTQAQAAIEKQLSNNPTTRGAALAEGLRKLAVAPLVVFDSVDTARRLVEVSQVSRTP
jgi:plasmid stabilization system protein ParE